MKTVQHSIEIWKNENGKDFTCEISLGPCPHCLGYELVVSDVEVQGSAPENYPQAVHCGGCGARGPWGGKTEEGAVKKWNDSIGVRSVLSNWQEVQMSPDEPRCRQRRAILIPSNQLTQP